MNNLHFGTDGIRGIYGKEIFDSTATNLGKILGAKGRVLIGYDNRLSSISLAESLAGGILGVGSSYECVGLTTTPCLYYLLTKSSADYAVMITASHNPPIHNGLKVFDKAGKITSEFVREIESSFDNECKAVHSPLHITKNALAPYQTFFKSNFDLSNMNIVVDFAHGAGCVFRDMLSYCGANVITINDTPNGEKINENCGALHIENCKKITMESGADFGFALDGDGDRIVAVTKSGAILNGDNILYIIGDYLKNRGQLKKNKLVTTIMTNSGIIRALDSIGITAVSCNVGDYNVLETMKSEGLNLGGEQSGHIIIGDKIMTGDGLLTGAMLGKIIKESVPLEELNRAKAYPQILINIQTNKKYLAHDERLQDTAMQLKNEMQSGRLLVRASGTENLIRIMAEHPDEIVAEKSANALADLLQALIAKA